MPYGRDNARAVRGMQIAVMAGAAALGVAVVSFVSMAVEVRMNRKEIRWLQARLAEKRETIQQQRAELRVLNEAADRIARVVVPVRERAAQARRLAHLEESREAEFTPVVAAVSADAAAAVTSPEVARARETLGWLEGQVGNLSESLALMAVLFKERPTGTRGSIPTFWPVRGSVTSEFGARPDPYGGGFELHAGLDIKAPYGTPVLAPGTGEVVFTGREGGYGTLVVVDHGRDVRSLFGHLAAIYVRVGQHVKAGDALGSVGRSGRATGVHLHYEVRVGDRPVDPRVYLGGASDGRKGLAAGGTVVPIRPAAIDVPRRTARAGLVER